MEFWYGFWIGFHWKWTLCVFITQRSAHSHWLVLQRSAPEDVSKLECGVSATGAIEPSNNVVKWGCTFSGAPPLLGQWGVKLAGEPTDVLSLKKSAFYMKSTKSLIFVTLCGTQNTWSLRYDVLVLLLSYILTKQHYINISFISLSLNRAWNRSC